MNNGCRFCSETVLNNHNHQNMYTFRNSVIVVVTVVVMMIIIIIIILIIIIIIIITIIVSVFIIFLMILINKYSIKVTKYQADFKCKMIIFWELSQTGSRRILSHGFQVMFSLFESCVIKIWYHYVQILLSHTTVSWQINCHVRVRVHVHVHLRVRAVPRMCIPVPDQ